MRTVIQRVLRAQVTVDQKVVGAIKQGLVVLLGVEEGDTELDAKYLAEKTANLRIFSDDNGKMNRSVVDVTGALLVISQFTLLGDCRKGRRPTFITAAEPKTGDRLYQEYCKQLEEFELPVEQGVFQADMKVELVNDGPVTILLDSRKVF